MPLYGVGALLLLTGWCSCRPPLARAAQRRETRPADAGISEAGWGFGIRSNWPGLALVSLGAVLGLSGHDGGVGLAQAIVNTVREPFLVLDSNLRVVVASRSYCQTFQTTPEDTQGRMLYELGAGEWNIPALPL